MSNLHVFFTPSSSESISSQILASIENNGCSTTVNNSFDPGILFDTEEDALPVVFLVLDTDQTKAEKQLELLFERQKFFNFPLILYGTSPSSGVEVKAAKVFPLVVWADGQQPFGEVDKALTRVKRDYPNRVATPQPSSGSTEEVSTDIQTEASYLDSLFKYQPSVNFSASKIGLKYALPKSRASFNYDKEIGDTAVRTEFSQFAKRHSARSFSHVRRVFSVGRDIQTASNLWELEDATLEAAFTLYLSSCEPNEQAVITGNYLEDMSPLRSTLAERMQSSGKLIEEKTGNVKASVIVTTAGELLAKNGVSKDSEDGESASFLLGLDLLDRNCWSHGHWQPRWAKRFMNSIIDNELPFLSRKTAWTLLQLLVSAFENLHTVKNVMVKKVRNEFGEEQVVVPQKQGKPVGHKVPLSQLQPGMVLSEAVCASDGTEILPKEFEIDSEIIVRLWNLAATRPIRSPQITRESYERYKRV